MIWKPESLSIFKKPSIFNSGIFDPDPKILKSGILIAKRWPSVITIKWTIKLL